MKRSILPLILLAVGCMTQPRNGGLRAFNDVDFQGYTLTRNSTIEFVGSQTKGGAEVAFPTTAQTNPDCVQYDDQCLYPYSLADQEVPREAVNCTDPENPFVWIKANEGETDLGTFDLGDDITTCKEGKAWQVFNQPKSAGGCLSNDTPWVKVFLANYPYCPCELDPIYYTCEPEQEFTQWAPNGQGLCSEPPSPDGRCFQGCEVEPFDGRYDTKAGCESVGGQFLVNPPGILCDLEGNRLACEPAFGYVE